MKKILTVLTFVLLAVFGAAKANAHTFSTGNMTGTIGKYKIVMSLTINDSNNTVSGWYYYKSKGPKNKIKLSGTFRELQPQFGYTIHIDMKEYVGGKVTGTFNIDYYQQSKSGIDLMWIAGDFTTATGKTFEVSADRSDRRQ